MFEANAVFKPEFIQQSPARLWKTISPQYSVDESALLAQLADLARPDPQQLAAVTRRATDLVEQVRAREDSIHMIDSMLLQYSLDTREGILLMCLAEALMRIPDSETADALIRDKLSVAEWERHLKQSDSLLVNASTWGLMLTGKVVTLGKSEDGRPASVIGRLVKKMGEPVIRQAVNQAMKIMGEHFVLGRTIAEALKNGRKPREKGYTYSFDMLGEAALTESDAQKYLASYLAAVRSVGQEQKGGYKGPRPTVSIKLSALHPRYEVANETRVLKELFNSVLELIRSARSLNVGITIDAEEQDRLELSLKLFEKLYRHPDCQGWGGFGLVVQAYGKRALPVLAWLAALAKEQGDEIPVRLVKGAYWDSEIKLCQQSGYSGYPVYTRKEATDVAYLVCARFLLSDPVKGAIYPQFATHNAHTVASILSMAEHKHFEFQRLHGMGDALYNTVLDQEKTDVRIYAPVGSHKDLLPYLVRRLLENGANSSFVHRLVDARTPVKDLVPHPVSVLEQHSSLANDQIPLPVDIFGKDRVNSMGVNIDIESQWQPFSELIQKFMSQIWHKGPVISGQKVETEKAVDVQCPYQLSELAGRLHYAGEKEVDQAISVAHKAFDRWSQTPVETRAQSLEKLADLLEANLEELVALCHKEAGKTIHDSIDEVREAVDFCRYYANQAREKFSAPQVMPGPTGESNELYLTGRGVFLCISPWNFPLAIFLGQVVAALACGNTVVAKPAEQTTLIAARAVEMMLEAGVPADVIQLVTGEGKDIGHQLTADPRIAGVAFTGSTQTARLINQTLAAREGAIIPLIAETGGQNAMIVDSTALPEQVVNDVVQSAFASAGQRCSALRVLYVQEDIADRIEDLLVGAMAELKVGNPALHETDLGPVISEVALKGLQAHVDRMKQEARLIAEVDLGTECNEGYFIGPVAFEIESINQLEKEQFGPILHLVRYKASELDKVIQEINGTGYGLTLGVHSRNEATSSYIEQSLKVGNAYINRNQIGAVVGVQPFGGQGLSGTGPKAGGPHYLYRFATERTRTINTTAVGGNATLLSLGAGH
ncbi:bifunctional proline dehydrogenase/L-glutamate gamma-semialdehyde dehydrogenase PutA [Endozoicomonas sp. 8E]|uniref:bifunctional proline dehydrogenase/L-glutamate gamma-semialdehyde dehydrogenase PutA n=1 Tax=Endozoicomonas sp. 8E TaxID=3035692 RepID=UPI00293951A5|nr:bifunctional proline dehydrogenase/L-glutamate gamma-semialdehyde dehydrogenase PutA [Endozoicomonas sp. 8E]WOG29017.1 bifunctional proline dehydrogenase/L-glutamate gamma-semialdehyde dehydrogenase PutA [Endozoicomonas sp. 8E]